MDPIEVRRCVQMLITEKVTRGEMLEQLIDEAVGEMPGELTDGLVGFIAAGTVVSPDVGEPKNMLHYVARSTQAMITALGSELAEARGEPVEGFLPKWLEAVVRFDSNGDHLSHRVAQLLIGVLSVPDVLLREQMFGALVDRVLYGTHSVIFGLLDLLRAAIAAANGVPEGLIVRMLLDRADEIMSGMADANGCAVEEQVARAWMNLESSVGAG